MSSLIPLWRELHRLLPNHRLVVVGKNGREEKNIRGLLRRMPRVHTLDKVPLPILARLFESASAVIQPSVYEGFGYPVYEAVAAGKSVLVGDVALYDGRIKGQLQQLKFSNADVKQLILLTKQRSEKKPPQFLFTQYQNSARKLISLYHSSTGTLLEL